MNEFLRPWKLITLAIGIAILIAGSFYYVIPDWDIPISLIDLPPSVVPVVAL